VENLGFVKNLHDDLLAELCREGEKVALFSLCFWACLGGIAVKTEIHSCCLEYISSALK
jgi:hypothetical protein